MHNSLKPTGDVVIPHHIAMANDIKDKIFTAEIIDISALKNPEDVDYASSSGWWIAGNKFKKG